ncbi:unnamed protein product [Alopecurus aequalis]
MAAPFLLLLLLVASGGAVVDGGDGAGLPHLALHGIEGSGRGHATATASEIFREHVVAGTGGGLTVFCPDDRAVAAFEPKFNSLSVDDQIAVLLHHVTAPRYGREQLAALEWAAVRTLANDDATNKSLALTLRDDGDTVWLWPYPPSRGSRAAARVTKAVSSDESPLAQYVVDAVLLPCHLGAACSPCALGGFLGWLHCTIPVWAGLCMGAASMLGVLTGVFVTLFSASA